MGGQACILYGAAEFSRDIDLAIMADPDNLSRLAKVLSALKAESVAVPPFHRKYLNRGHAVHFRCMDPDVERMRIDIMSKMRGVDAFPKLWRRRTTIILPDNLACHLLSLPDLVKAKKTQRDKDWPMIRRLLEAHYFQYQNNPTRAQIAFWLLELRTPELLVDTAQHYPRICGRLAVDRPLLAHALSGNTEDIANALLEEELKERKKDRLYWLPLRKELEILRRAVGNRD
jgi:hypothetical protein